MRCSLTVSSVHGILLEEYWSGFPFPSLGDVPDPGIELRSPAQQADIIYHLNHQRNPTATLDCFISMSCFDKIMTNLDSILKSRDITLSTKVHLVKAMVFPVVMYGCESWTIKKAEHQRIAGFELWCWRRLLRVPWTARRFNQSILKELSPGCSLEELISKLKLQYFGLLMWRADSLEKTLMLGKTEGRRRRGWQDEIVGWHHRHNGHGFGWALGLGDGQGGLACCS